jgi:hypothetical protein
MGDQPDLCVDRIAHKKMQTWVEFESTVPMFGWPKIMCVLDCTATGIGSKLIIQLQIVYNVM